MMKVFKFEHPEYLFAIAVVIILYLIWFIIRRVDKKSMLKFGDQKLISQMIVGQSNQKKLWKFFFINFAIVMISIALANPQIGSKMEKSTRKGADLIIALDISNSMLAQDIKPNRITRSKLAISKLVDQLEGDRLGIVVFAADAYTQLPITTDYGAAKMFLSSVTTDYINNQGTSIAAAIELARQSFNNERDKGEKKNKALVIITDGEDHEEGAIEAAKQAKEDGITIYTIGMGLPSGSPIPIIKNGVKQGYKKDREGNTVVTKLNASLLEKIAKAGNGYFVRANNSNTGLNKIFRSINKMDKEEIETRNFKEYEGWFQIFVLIAIAFLVFDASLGEKKGKLASKINIFNKEEELI